MGKKGKRRNVAEKNGSKIKIQMKSKRGKRKGEKKRKNEIK